MQAPVQTSQTSGPAAADIMSQSEAQLLAILNDTKSAIFVKAKACQRLAVVGTRQAVPVLAKLLADARLNTYARYALQPIPDESVDAVLREALAKLKGGPRQGVMNSIGFRRDTKAVKAIARLLSDQDVETARTAAATLGKVGNPESAKELEKALTRTKGVLQETVAQSAVICIENLRTAGHSKEASSLVAMLRKGPAPKPVQTALAAEGTT